MPDSGSKRKLALFFGFGMMSRRGNAMRKVFFAFVLFVLLFATLPACSKNSDSLDNVRVSGDVTTVFGAGSGGHVQRTRTRTGLEF